MNESRIADLRRTKGWTQERLSEQSGVAVRTIQRLERGNDASLESLSLIAKALDVPVSELFETVQDDAFRVSVDGLDERAATQQTRRDAVVRAWNQGYVGLGVVLGMLVVVGIGLRWVPGPVIILVGVYWVGGRYLLRMLLDTVIEPRLDARFPLSRPTAPARDRDRRRRDPVG